MVVVSVVRDREMHRRLIGDNRFLAGCRTVVLDNSADNATIPRRYNQFIDSRDFPSQDWIAFVHEDFEFLEDPIGKIADLDRNSIYGVAGVTSGGRAHLAILNSARDGSGLVFSGCPYQGVREVATVDCMCLIVHSSLIAGCGLRFDENLSFDLYTEVFSADAKESRGIRTFVCPIRCRHWSFGTLGERFYGQLDYVRRKFAGSRHAYATTTMERFGVGSGPLDRKRTRWGRNDRGPFRVKMSEDGTLKVRFLGLTVFRRRWSLLEISRLRLLVVVHLYYRDQWDELRSCLANLTDDCDLFFTFVDESAAVEARQEYPGATFVKCANRGFDVWPFLKVLQSVDLGRYDAVVKLHTKRDFNIPEDAWINRVRMNGSAWRTRLLAFVRTPGNWRRSRGLICRPDVGMVADWSVVVGRMTPGLKMYRAEFDEAAARLGMSDDPAVARRGRYVAGTMFVAKPSGLRILLERINPSEDQFAVSARESGEQFAHLTERMLGLCVHLAGLRVVPFNAFVSLRRVFARANKGLCKLIRT